MPRRRAKRRGFNAAENREYARSNRTLEVPCRFDAATVAAAQRVAAALAADDRRALGPAVQATVDGLCRGAGAPEIPVKVAAKRLKRGRVEFHGFCGRDGWITIYARTAVHNRPVAFKTFLRTLVHEAMHHFDWKVLGFDSSFHTGGFYARVRRLYSDLLKAVERGGQTHGAAERPAFGLFERVAADLTAAAALAAPSLFDGVGAGGVGGAPRVDRRSAGGAAPLPPAELPLFAGLAAARTGATLAPPPPPPLAPRVDGARR
ncbi:MAG: hypothetical protein HZA54_11310, partial [Planctomycetes bacterium]|nr:hypothetical protein [Planctomycetota bacterium]